MNEDRLKREYEQIMADMECITADPEHAEIFGGTRSIKTRLRSNAESGYPLGMVKHGKLLLLEAERVADVKVALSWMEKALDKGCYEAAVELLNFYEEPSKYTDVPWDADKEKSMEYIKVGAEHNEPYCCSRYALHIFAQPYAFEGEWPEKLFHYAKIGADAGFEVAQLLVAHCYLEGAGVRFDLDAAEKYLHMCEGMGEAAELKLQEVAQIREIIKSNPSLDPAKLFSLADKGDADSADRLGYMYTVGLIFRIDPVKAAEYFAISIPQHIDNFFSALLKDEDIRKDKDQLKTLRKVLELLGEKGVGNAFTKLSETYLHEIDIENSSKWLERAAEADEPEAFSQLASCYEIGYGDNKPDGDKCIKTLERGVALGDLYCCYRLSEMYKEGKFVKKDLRKAEAYQRIVAMQTGSKDIAPMRDEHMQNLLNQFIVSPGDDETARFYAKLAANSHSYPEDTDFLVAAKSFMRTKGDSEAQKDKLRYIMRAIIENPDKDTHGRISYLGAYAERLGYKNEALKLYELAARLREDDYPFYLACCLLTGLGVEVDGGKALQIFRAGAVKKDSLCESFLSEYAKTVKSEDFTSLDIKTALRITEYLKYGFNTD